MILPPNGGLCFGTDLSLFLFLFLFFLLFFFIFIFFFYLTILFIFMSIPLGTADVCGSRYINPDYRSGIPITRMISASILSPLIALAMEP